MGREYDWTVHWKVVCVTSVVCGVLCVCVCVCVGGGGGGGEGGRHVHECTHPHTHTHTHTHTGSIFLMRRPLVGRPSQSGS